MKKLTFWQSLFTDQGEAFAFFATLILTPLMVFGMLYSDTYSPGWWIFLSFAVAFAGGCFGCWYSANKKKNQINNNQIPFKGYLAEYWESKK